MGNYNFSLDLNSKNTMSIIIDWINDGADILEFGPANGRLTKYLYDIKKCNVTIVEMDEDAGKEASDYAVLSYLGDVCGDIEKFYWYDENKKYDYIICADVIEHLHNPREVIAKCKTSLKNNGKILVSIPNIAHNSVLIDLLNDKFEYGNTGLLDKTHIHFFTYSSFLEMIRSCNLYIEKSDVIYSRVGNNEILNDYLDVPKEVEEFLRKRISGSIYQYVFCLTDNYEESRKNSLDVRVMLEEDKKRMFESKLFLENGEGKFDEKNRISEFYYNNNCVKLHFDIGDRDINGKKIRWDPMEYSLVIRIVNQEMIFENGDRKVLCCFNDNSDFNYNDFFVFSTLDPQVEFYINTTKKVMAIEFIFELIDYRIDEEKIGKYIDFLKNFSIQNLRLREEIEIEKNRLKKLEDNINTALEVIRKDK